MSRVDPPLVLGRRGETYVLTKVGDRLSRARHAHAVGRWRDPVTALRFNDGADIEVDAANAASEAATGAALKRNVDASTLRWNTGLTRKNRL